MKYNLQRHVGISFADFNDTDLTELIWMENRLAEEMKKQKEELEKHAEKLR